MTFTLCLNSSNVLQGTSNSSFRFNFANGGFTAKDSEICISTLTMPYSIFNITSRYNNNNFVIFFPKTVGYASAPVTLPNGFYSVTDLQNYIQQVCITNGFYLIDSAGNYVFYTYLTYSPTYYAVQLVQTLVPTSLPAGWTQPSTWQGYSAISYTPSLYLDPANSIAPIIGFDPTPVYFPVFNTISNYSTLSTLTPQGSTVNSLVARCSLVNNSSSVPTDIMDGFPINATFGSNIIFDPSFEHFVDVRDGTYQSLTFTIVDQNLNQIVAQDPNVSIVLMIRSKNPL